MGTPVELFDYQLPKELIAKYPNPERDACRLMVMDKFTGEISDKIFTDIADILTENDFLVVNNTKVRKARLDASKPTGGKSELFITEVFDPHSFKALVRGKFQKGDTINLTKGSAILIEKDIDGVWFAKSDENIESLMNDFGHIPLPPYIDRQDEQSDRINYQTVYAKTEGSAAAATAGLHFTKNLLQKLNDKGVQTMEITLEVGLGTFRPVKTATIEEHRMHSERYEITPETADKINRLKSCGKNLVAVGSTVVRTLESAIQNKKYLEGDKSSTSILISPPYQFTIVDAMITNFHLPKSTLLAMVAAFGGYENTMRAYTLAVKKGYNFFSYGDAMLIKALSV